MIGSMGLASSIGLGLALKNPNKHVYVFDGDGNILMNLGSLVTIGSLKPKNLIHVIFDNNSHESTGGQPTNSTNVKIDMIAKATNYKVFKISSQNRLQKLLKNIKSFSGPLLLLVKIEKSKYVSKRIDIEPTLIKTRFMRTINN
jgi:thiamine pyrophosphate-dependent acetolactate synthase large subunit-like protein